jgi:disulfide bond formation protein DsbB
MKRRSTFRIENYLNEIGILIVSGLLITAFYYQIVLNELPCPLCLLQRAGIILTGAGLLFNLRFGSSVRHFAMSLIGCVVTGLVATRQVFLHIASTAPGYGNTLFGLHLYTWTLLFSVGAIVGISLILMLPLPQDDEQTQRKNRIGTIAVAIFIIVVSVNLVSVLLECGTGQCQDNPVFYQLLTEW